MDKIKVLKLINEGCRTPEILSKELCIKLFESQDIFNSLYKEELIDKYSFSSPLREIQDGVKTIYILTDAGKKLIDHI
jgi:transcription initiation factor IIE alpha subunit